MKCLILLVLLLSPPTTESFLVVRHSLSSSSSSSSPAAAAAPKQDHQWQWLQQPVTPIGHGSMDVCLWMAQSATSSSRRNPAGAGGGSGKQKKKKDNPYSGKITKNMSKKTIPGNKSTASSSSSSASSRKVTGESVSSSRSNNKKNNNMASTTSPSLMSSTPPSGKVPHTAPPWQVISTKDMARNLQAEKERRSVAQEHGRHATPGQIQDAQAEYRRSRAFLSPTDQALLSWRPFSLQTRNGKHDVAFQGAYLNQQLPPRLGVPEVAFLGRSNVGKSSLLNRLVGRGGADVARVGRTPGATASVNLYAILDIEKGQRRPLMGLVDLPGFGYAKLDKATKESVQEAAELYLERRKELALGILLVDCRRTPTVDDKAVLAALFDMGLPIVVVATKADKLSSQAQIDQALATINRELGLPEGQPLCVSSVSGRGISDLWRIIMEACEGRVEELANLVELGEEAPYPDASELEMDGEVFDDDADVAYSQGYDWIQDSVMYEAEDGDEEWYDDGHNQDAVIDDDEANGNLDHNDDPSDFSTPNMSIKFLRKKARDMERRGEI